MSRNPFQQLEEERRENEIRLEKMKQEMESVFDQKVKEKIARLKESELNVIFFLLNDILFLLNFNNLTNDEILI